ncbi:MAG: ABC transporter ATP-binding protein [Calditrichaeota bacterium]|nr:MAG: ABC transporter ATP-binding protein [Calditrichota bacterium]
MSTQSILKTENLRKVYRNGRKRVCALSAVTLELQAGETFAVLGPNGAGKTTLVKILLNLIRADSGKAFILGHPVSHPFARRTLGYVPEDLSLPNFPSGAGFLRFLGRLSGIAERQLESRIHELLAQTELHNVNQPLKKFSKGMKRRLSLAQAFLHRPDLLILDEPTDGLDPIERQRVLKLLVEHRDKGGTILLCSHLLTEVETLCDRYAILDGGKMVHAGTRRDFDADGYQITLTSTLKPELQSRLPNGCELKAEDGTQYLLVKGKALLPEVMTLLRELGVEFGEVLPNRTHLDALFLRYIERSSTENR